MRDEIEAILLNSERDPYVVLAEVQAVLARWAAGEGIPQQQYMAIAGRKAAEEYGQ
jgi:hypothetical protein